MAINIDFTILEETLQPKQIHILDLSDWGSIVDSPSNISVVVPGYNTPITNIFFKNEINVLTAKGLGLQDINCQYDADLPDGVYQITVSGTPTTYTKTRTFIKVDLLKLKLNKYIVSLYNNSCDISSEARESALTIAFLIEVAKASIVMGDWCKATDVYRQASKMLNNLDCRN